MQNFKVNNYGLLSKIVAISTLILLFNTSFAQTITQTIRGKVTDLDTRGALPGANVVILGTNPVLGGVTDMEGNFRIDKVPVGRVSLQITYIGYEERLLPNLLVTSAKELILDVTMQESLTAMDEVVITAERDKAEVDNDMALISARGFTVEETKRYAGSFNDPARMVSGYAGVTGDASGNNFIVVRGNSPKGIQWRLDGIEIPNPNHFSDEGATGGPINALNSQMLSNSEFYTGAFSPQYGNAFSGVFDMKLRKGNNEKREYSLSIGALGTEATAEGPFSKNSNASYLINYRYSTLAILDNLGLVDFDGVPKYQDMSFKVFVPTASMGTFSLFGLGGKSKILEKVYDEEDEDDLLEQGDYKADMGVIGLTHYLTLGKNSYLQNMVSVSTNGSAYKGYRPDENDNLQLHDDGTLDKNTWRAGSTFNHKFNAHHNLQAGVIYSQYYFDFTNTYFDEAESRFITDQNMNGDAGHYQGFVSWKYRPVEKLSLVSGFHMHGTTLNDELSFEPRASLKWQFNPTQAFTAGFGVHGKMESLTNYYSIIPDENGQATMPNMNLGFSKARHYVIGYENRLGANLFLKLEAYYQQLYNIPVEDDVNSSYSLVNQVEWFTDRKLVNEGKGKNLGLELTLERYFADNYFFMVTASAYDSKYTALDGVERNTRFNGNFAGNFLLGKEFLLSSSNNKSKVLGINTKISLLGAKRYTPINVDASMEQKEAVLYESEAFSLKEDNVFIANLAITYRIDRKKTSQELKLDLQNVTNNAARLDSYYNNVSNKVEYTEQLPLLPVIMYTIHF